jgi:predicted nucleic acid-binding protein
MHLSYISRRIGRIANLLDKYADTDLDFSDAAIAERYGITKIATFDHRDFSIIRPRHTAFFELLP